MHTRRLTPFVHYFWPIFSSVPLRDNIFGFDLDFVLIFSSFRFPSARSRPHILFYFEARRALWAPRSVGPYGLGRAPSPLMHAPTGGMHMGAHRAPIIGRDFFFLFVIARPLAFGSFPARIMPTLRVGIWKIFDFPL
jgi:hypothetical protein